MDIAEDSDKTGAEETPLVFQIARVVVVAAIISVAVWLATGYALDWIGAPFLK